MFEFDWDEANLGHIARHGVTPEEAEEICAADSLVLDFYEVDDEDRFEEVGQTKAGRILKVVTTERAHKIRVVTAFDAALPERRAFLLSKGKPS